MIEIAKFDVFGTKQEGSFFYVSPDQFQFLLNSIPAEYLKVWPDGGRSISVDRDIADPHVQFILAYLKSHGYRAVRCGERSDQNDFSMAIVRQFSDDELLSAPYLNVMMQSSFAQRLDVTMDGQKTMLLRAEVQKRKRKLGCVTDSQWIFITAETVDSMEKLGINVSFQKVYDLGPPHELIENVFKFASSVDLPSLRGLTYLDCDGKPHNGDPAVPIFPYEGLYEIPQLQFLKTEFEKVAPFDFAYSREGFYGPPRMLVHKNVCSNRMFRFLRKHDKKLIATPIRLL